MNIWILESERNEITEMTNLMSNMRKSVLNFNASFQLNLAINSLEHSCEVTVNLIQSKLLWLSRWEKWFQGKFVPVVSIDRKGKILGPVLSFEKVTATQNGSYSLEIMNSLGSFTLTVDLIVSNVPRVEVSPKKKTVRIGENVELKCEIPDVLPSHAEIRYVRLFHASENSFDVVVTFSFSFVIKPNAINLTRLFSSFPQLVP